MSVRAEAKDKKEFPKVMLAMGIPGQQVKPKV